MRVVTFKVDEDLYEMLENQAVERGLSKSELLRRALREYLSSLVDKPYITRRVRVYTEPFPERMVVVGRRAV